MIGAFVIVGVVVLFAALIFGLARDGNWKSKGQTGPEPPSPDAWDDSPYSE